jgi:hypothetical protein
MDQTGQPFVHPRAPQVRKVVVTTEEGDIITNCISRNISLTGIYIESDAILPINCACKMAIIVNESITPIAIMTEGRVVRSDTNGFAVHFSYIDRESYAQLCNIISYNLCH